MLKYSKIINNNQQNMTYLSIIIACLLGTSKQTNHCFTFGGTKIAGAQTAFSYLVQANTIETVVNNLWDFYTPGREFNSCQNSGCTMTKCVDGSVVGSDFDGKLTVDRGVVFPLTCIDMFCAAPVMIQKPCCSFTHRFTLEVYCPANCVLPTSILFDQNPYAITNKVHLADNTIPYYELDYFTNFCNALCPITMYEVLLISNTAPSSVGQLVAQLFNTGSKLRVQVQSAFKNDYNIFTFQIKATTSGTVIISTTQLVLLVCDSAYSTLHSTVGMIVSPFDSPVLQSPPNELKFNVFYCNNPVCCNPLTYHISTSATSNVPSSSLKVTQTNYGNQIGLKVSDTNTVASYTFFLYTVSTFGNIVAPQFTLIVSCSLPSQTVITILPFNNGNTDVQNVRVNDKDLGRQTHFELPPYHNSNNICQIIAVKVIEVSSEAPHPLLSQQAILGAANTTKPTDIEIPREYQFRYMITAQGGSKTISPVFKLFVGCNSSLSFTESPSFKKDVQVVMGSQKNNFYTITPPQLSEAWCPIIEYQLEYMIKDKQANQTIVIFDSFCTTQPCTKLDLLTTEEAMKVSFRIRTITEDGKSSLSNIVKVSIDCSANSITPSFSEQEFEYLQNFTHSESFNFKPFTCKFAFCCQTISYTTSSSGLPSASQIDSVSSPVSKASEVSVSLSLKALGLFTFYIHALSNGDNTAFSEGVNFKVKFNCKYDSLSLPIYTPDFQYATIVGDLSKIVKSWTKIDGKPRHFVKMNIGDASVYKLKVGKIFKQSSPAELCQITDFRITHVKDMSGRNVSNPSNLYEIDPQGTFSIKEFFAAYKHNQVFFSAKIDDVWIALSDYIFDISFDNSMPNYSPKFVEQLSEFEITTDPQNFTKEFTVSLPEVFDQNNDTAFFSVENPPSFVKFKEEQKEIVVIQWLITRLGRHEMTLWLEDRRGGRNKYKLVLIIKEPLEIPEQTNKQIEFQEEDQETKQFQAQNYSAKIMQIQSNGLINIVFDTILVDEGRGLNVSLIDESTLNITLLPSQESLAHAKFLPDLKDHFNFTWKAKMLKIDKLDIQLKFKYPLLISQGLTQRDIVQIQFHDFTYLKPFNEGLPFDENKRVITRTISKQLLNDFFSRSLTSFAKGMKSNLYILAIDQVVVNIFVRMGVNQIISGIEVLQIMTFQSYINTGNPANLQTFQNIIVQILSFDIFDPSYTTMNVLDFDQDVEHAEKKLEEGSSGILTHHLTEFGFETLNPILNLNGLFFFVFFAILVFSASFIVLAVKYIQKTWQASKQRFMAEGGQVQDVGQLLQSRKQRLKLLSASIKQNIYGIPQTLKKKLQVFFYNLPFQILIEAIIPMAISGFLFFEMKRDQHGDFEFDFTTNLSNIFGYLCLFFVFVFLPLSHIAIFFIKKDTLTSQDMIDKIGALYQNVDMSKKFHFICRILFYTRRILISYVVVFWQNSQGIKLVWILHFNLLCSVFIGNVSPFSPKDINLIESINEFLLMQSSVLLVCFTDFLRERKYDYELEQLLETLDVEEFTYQSYESLTIRYNIGWIEILLVMACIFLHVQGIFRNQVQSIRLVCVKNGSRFKRFVMKKLGYDFKEEEKENAEAKQYADMLANSMRESLETEMQRQHDLNILIIDQNEDLEFSHPSESPHSSNLRVVREDSFSKRPQENVFVSDQKMNLDLNSESSSQSLQKKIEQDRPLIMKNVTVEQTRGARPLARVNIEKRGSPKKFKKVKFELESIEEEEVDVSSNKAQKHNGKGKSEKKKNGPQIIVEELESPGLRMQPQADLELGLIRPIQNSPPPLPNAPVTRQRVLMDQARAKLLKNPKSLLTTLDSLKDLHPAEKVRLFYEINTLNYIKKTYNKMSNFSSQLAPSQQIQMFDKLFNFEEFLERQRTSSKRFKLSYTTVKQDLSLQFVREMVLPFYQAQQSVEVKPYHFFSIQYVLGHDSVVKREGTKKPEDQPDLNTHILNKIKNFELQEFTFSVRL